ncbi:monovalent cation:proton antiporter family protein [Mesonia sp. HuA40]|uniref:monovalent cation:proton antiporter family protein n=1 Tax=Mesonia sp. HuA40 TaxID=2602761 RepID=UPI0011CCACEA|nr:monovalent cation:proton antiporter family protein [Mesonia sp. HuA40]TXK71031.1 potassium transporter KefB [Mesonia sp. HuA40]
MHIPILQDILILLGFSVIIVFLLQRLKIPSIIGFLFTGIIIGPSVLSLVTAVEQIEIISEIGVIMLLFVIGMELSIKQLASIKKTVFIGGGLQVLLSILIAGSFYYFLGFSWEESIFVGFLFSLSSTAIVLSVLQDRNEINTNYGKNTLAILIFQDIIVVPMMLFTPIIAGQSDNVTQSILLLLLKTAVVVIITIISAKYVVPKLLYAVAKTRSKELFLLTTITICFAVAFLTSETGLSLALGAFLAGLIISESEFSHQATNIILPFKELFTSFFFISIGMLLDINFFLENFLIIILVVLALLLIKSSLIALCIRLLGYQMRTAILTGFALFQVGEFAFILSKVGIENNLLSTTTNQYFLAISIVSMMISPFVILYASRFTDSVLGNKLVRALQKNPQQHEEELETDDKELKNHLVIIGYGINGSNLAKAAYQCNIPFVVIEYNAETVKREKKNNIPIIYGDASHSHILEKVNVVHARTVVIAISDDKATKAIIGTIRSLSKSVHLIVRTRYIKQINQLISLGADEVIPEEFETSVEIFSRVMHNFLIPEEDIHHFVEYIRADNYELLQNKKELIRTYNPKPTHPEFNITCVRVIRDSGKLIQKPLSQLNLRENFGVNILAIKRKGIMIDNVGPEEKIMQHDLVFINGNPENIERFNKALV